MNPFRRLILSAAAITFLSGCSSSDRPAPSAFTAQPRLAHASAAIAAPPSAATIALGTLTIPDAGYADPDAARAALGDPNVISRLRTLALNASSGAGVSSPVTMVAVAAADHQA